MEQLTRLKINKYRHIKPGTELRFNSGFNVLLGKNGTGKTTLLDLISIVISSDFSSLRGEEFDLEYEIELAGLWMEVKVSNGPTPQTHEIYNHFNLPPEMTWNVEADVHINEGNQYYHATVNKQTLIFKEGAKILLTRPPNTSIFNETSPFVASDLLIIDMPQLTQGSRYSLLLSSSLVLESWCRICRFDESLGVFGVILDQRVTKHQRNRATIILPIMKNGDIYHPTIGFYPKDLLSAFVEKFRANHRLTTYELTEKESEFLSNFAKLIGASSIKIVLSLNERSSGELARYAFKIREFIVEYPDGRYITHEELSYGQKRLLAFLYYLAANEKFVIADELTDSFHHSWIEFCMERLKTRQCFLSSQNPILLDYLPIGSEEDAKKTFIQCRLEPNGNKEQMVWRNLSDEEAESFYKDLAVGIQSVSEVLMFRGLW